MADQVTGQESGWLVDGELQQTNAPSGAPVDSTQSSTQASTQAAQPSQWKVDGKPVQEAHPGFLGGSSVQANRFQPSYTNIPDSVSNAVPTPIKNVGKAAYDFFAGAGSGPLQTIMGGVDSIIPDSIEPDFVKQARGYLHDVGTYSTASRLGQGTEQIMEYFIRIGPKAVWALAQKGGPLARAAWGFLTNAVNAGIISHAQSGGDFRTSVPTALLSGATAGATAGLGGVYDKVAGLTQDVDPARIKASTFANSEGITLDPAARTGSPFLRQTKKFLSSGPMAGESQDLSQLQSQQYADLGDRTIDIVAHGQPVGDPEQVGQAAYNSLSGKADQLAQKAQQAYGGLDAFTKTIPAQKLQVKTWEMKPTRAVTALGQPISTPVQIMVDRYFKIPVDRSAVQQTLRPILAKWESTLPIASKDASPGLVAMRNLVYGDSIVEADTALKDLHALYQAQRLEPGDIGRDLSQHIAKESMMAYRTATDQAISQVNPSLLQLVNEGRAATGKKYAIYDLMKTLGGRVDSGNAYKPSNLEPVRVFQALTKNKDAGITALRQFQTAAPDQIPAVASTMLQGLVDQAGQFGAAESYAGAKGALAAWNRVGPETKNLLFGASMSQDLDQFFKLGTFLAENPNPSNTGMHVWMAARLVSLLQRPGTLAKDVGFEYALGKYLFSNGGALPYMSQIRPGVFGVNPAAAMVGGTFRQLTGINPDTFQKQGQGQNHKIDPNKPFKLDLSGVSNR